MVKFLSLMFIFYSMSLGAAFTPWPSKTRRVLTDYPLLEVKDKFISSVWGTLNEPVYSFSEVDAGSRRPGRRDPRRRIKRISKFEELYLRHDAFSDGTMKVHLNLHKDYRRKMRPLTIVLPGVFTDLKDNNSMRFAVTSFKDGSHTVQFPNPLSVDYLRNRPLHAYGDIFTESKIYFETIRELIRTLVDDRSLKISDVRILGASYGAFMTAVMSSFETDRYTEMIQSYLLISPPFDMLEGLRQMDLYLEKTVAYLRPNQTLFYLDDVARIAARTIFRIFTPKDSKKAMGIVAHIGFQNLFLKSLKFAQQENGTFYYPELSGPLSDEEEVEFKKQLRFISYTRDFVPSTFERLQGQEGSIMYWLSKRPEQSFDLSKVRILTSADDFLNQPEVWPEDPGVVVMPTGGHMGFRGTKWLDRMINLAF